MAHGARQALEQGEETERHVSSEISIEQFRSITEIDAAEWAHLAGTNVLAHHGLLRTIEETGIGRHGCRYFVARNETGPLGAIVSRIEDKAHADGTIPLGGHRLDKMLFGKFATAARYAGVIGLPCLVCGNPLGPSEPVLVRPGATAPESKRIVEALVRAVELAARREKWSICFRQVGRGESSIAQVLTERGYLRGSELPTAYLDLKPEWLSFADYRKHLKKAHSKMATNVNRELSKAKRVGLVIETVEAPEACSQELHSLIEAHNLRHNGKPCPVHVDFFKNIKGRMGDAIAITTARVGGALCAVQVRLQAGSEMVAWMTGIDDKVAREASAYFNLNYNHTIEYMIAAGYRRINYGALLWDVKARRGCMALESDFYFHSRNPLQRAVLKPLIKVRSQRNDALSAPIRQIKAEQGDDGPLRKDGGDDN